eukprot:s251_g3.t3
METIGLKTPGAKVYLVSSPPHQLLLGIACLSILVIVLLSLEFVRLQDVLDATNHLVVRVKTTEFVQGYNSWAEADDSVLQDHPLTPRSCNLKATMTPTCGYLLTRTPQDVCRSRAMGVCKGDWLASLQAACTHEFVPGWLRKRRSCEVPPGDWPTLLEVSVNGSGIAGTYRLQAREPGAPPNYACDEVPGTCLRFSESLGLWVLISMPPVNKAQELSGAERAERTRHFYRLSTPAVGWQLLYVGNAVSNLADVDWIPVLGPAPAPRTAPPVSKVLLTVDSLQIGRSTKLSAETASQVLSWLLDLGSLRLKSSIRTQPSNWICDTAPHVAMWIHGHAGDAKALAAVCTAWRNVAQLYRSRWPQDFRRLLQLDVGHGWPVASAREALQVLARASWQNMLHLTDFPAFRDNAWPAHVTSVALKMPVRTQLDN